MSPDRAGFLRPWVFAVAIAALVLLAYANSFPGAFFFDDGAGIVENTSIRNLHDLRRVLWPPVEAGIGGRPFANLTFALNYRFGGLTPANCHAVNLAIHLVTALLLFGLTRRTLRLPGLRNQFGTSATLIALIVALLWGLHPLQTSIVDYASQRTEGLMAMLYLLTLYSFLRSVEVGEPGVPVSRRSSVWIAIAFLACLLGMATKEDMATVPVLVLLFDRAFLSGSFENSLRWRRDKYVALAITWVLLFALFLTSHPGARGVGFGLGRTWYGYAFTECRSVALYLKLSFWPHPLIFDYGPKFIAWREALPWTAVLVLALGASVYALWRFPRIGFAAISFFILLSPSSSVIPVAQQPCAENRVYLPLAGAVVVLAVLAFRAAGRRAMLALIGASLALAVLTAARNPAFRSETAIWSDTVAKNPGNERAQNNLGNALLKTGKTALAGPYFDAAIRISPTYADALNNRGVTKLRLGHPAEALPSFIEALKYKDKFKDAQYNLGEAYLELGRTADALAALRVDVKIDPDNPRVRNNYGMALLDSGHVDEAIAEEKTALRLDPNLPEAHYNLGNAFGRAGKISDALAEYAKTVQIDPNFAKAYNNAGVLLLQQGRNAEAKTHFQAALKINPQYPDARRNLALVGGRPL